MTAEPSPMTAANIWVLVCTYQRNDLLVRLLESLQTVTMPQSTARPAPRLIVVDNAEQPTAEQTVGETYPSAVYLHEPEPGIAVARNTALDAVPADAEAVIFVDDDEQVTPGWFAALLECANASGADAVTGPVLPVFAGGEPEWVNSYGYVRRRDFATGPHPRRVATNNTLVRAEWFTQRGFRFDEAFNLTGGSDSDLFERMARSGARYWWCAEAVVTEHVPAQRASRQWLRRRALRGGQVRAMKRRRDAGPFRAVLRIGAEGVARAGYGSLRRVGKHLRRRPITYTDDYYLCEGLGMLGSLIGRDRAEYGRGSGGTQES